MGLDMTLSGKRYVRGYEGSPESEQKLYKDTMESLGLTGLGEGTHMYVTFTAMDWRKCSAVHNWFVVNVQDGEDNCGSYGVSREQIGELIDLCERVAKSGDPEYAEEHLPTSMGSFFGSTEYDEYYFEQIDETARRLAEILTQLPETPDFFTNVRLEYSSSW